MSESFDLDDVQHFTAGAVGEPGARTFYLQTAAGGPLVTLKCEKQQVAALAEHLTGVVADLPPAERPPASLELLEPVTPDWVLGMMSVAYDDTTDRIVMLAEEALDPSTVDPDLPEPSPATLRVALTRGQVLAFIDHAAGLIEAGRPPCPLCGHPMGVDHICPRANGHAPPR